MSTFLTAAIVIAGTLGIVWPLIIINRKNSRRQNALLLSTFSQASSTRGFDISSQEMLTDHIIGVDSKKQQMLIHKFNEEPAFTSINLAELKSCAITKTFETVHYGNSKNFSAEQELQYIFLQLSFKQKNQDFSIPFYNSRVNSIYQKAELEKKAQFWELLINQMLKQPMMARV